MCKGGSMTSELFSQYLEAVVKRRGPNAIFTPPTLLILDQAASHKMDAITATKNMKGLFVPAGCTSLVQPLDVAVNKPFKCLMRAQWKTWMELPAAEHILTKKGHRQRVCIISMTFHSLQAFVIFYFKSQYDLFGPLQGTDIGKHTFIWFYYNYFMIVILL